MTNDNVGQPEQRQTHLIVPQGEAEQRIMAQIREGESLLNNSKSIQSKAQLFAAKDGYEDWREYTRALLKRRIFDADEQADKFAPQFDEYGYVRAPYTLRSLQSDLHRDLSRLRRIYKQVEQGLFPVQAPQSRPSEDEEGKKPIFINYRHVDGAPHAGRLHDWLSNRFGKDQIFLDIYTIELGLDFVEVIEKAVGSCDVLIAIIGKQWLTITDATGRRRLDDPEDLVRLEIVTALDRNIPVIPVLVGGATMPPKTNLPDALKKLSHRNALEISDTRFDYDVGRLIERLQKLLGMPEPPPPTPEVRKHP